MTDIFNKELRSIMMSKIGSKNSTIELAIRKGLHKLGFRYQLHRKDLPGKPDLVLPKYRAVIFINGCFWHAHNCHLFKWPTNNAEFWFAKIESNKIRDSKNYAKYVELNWKVLIIWGCSLKGKTRRNFNEVIHTAQNWLMYDNQNAEIEGRNK